ncbi:MAG: hypothetical protein LBV79_01070 [Candidatus Adiutrix sp.]|nr:hypothetical protein [Candidatus Adiutrix sp.]
MSSSWTEGLCPRLKIFIQTPAVAGCWAVGLCWLFCFGLWEPVYLTNDDATMRGILSGTHFPGVGPSEFTLYISTVLGVFIKALYLHWPGSNCYEIFFYLILSSSVWVSIYTLARVARQADYKYSIVILLVLPCILSVPFLGRQFTMVCALAAGSGLVVFYSLFNTPLTSPATWLAKGLYVIFALWLSSLIRFDAALTYGLVGGLYLLPLLPWRKAKKILALAVVAGLALFAVLGTEHINQTMIKNNPDWQYRKDMNRYVTSITNDSVFANTENLGPAWRLVAKNNISFSGENDGFHFGKEYFRLFLQYALIGEINVSNPSNMAKVSAKLAPLLSNKANSSLWPFLHHGVPIDRLSNYLWILLPVLLIFRNKKVWGLAMYFAVCFCIVSAAISFHYRPVPYRLWYGYSALFFLILVSYVGANYTSIQEALFPVPGSKNITLGTAAALLIVASLGASYSLVHKQQQYSHLLLRSNNAIEKDIQRLRFDKELLYIIDGITYFFSTAPLRPDPWHNASIKRIILTTTILDPSHHGVLKRYDIPLQNTMQYIGTHKDVRFLFAHKLTGMNFFIPYWGPFSSIAAFLRERHGLEIGAEDVAGVETEELAVMQLVPLNANGTDNSGK